MCSCSRHVFGRPALLLTQKCTFCLADPAAEEEPGGGPCGLCGEGEGDADIETASGRRYS